MAARAAQKARDELSDVDLLMVATQLTKTRGEKNGRVDGRVIVVADRGVRLSGGWTNADPGLPAVLPAAAYQAHVKYGSLPYHYTPVMLVLHALSAPLLIHSVSQKQGRSSSVLTILLDSR
jgi:hypothetical protein